MAKSGGASDAERKAAYWRLANAHPSGSPADREFFDYLINTPTIFSPTERWINFRDNLLRDADYKDNRKFIRQAELVLAYRATVPPEDRLWRPDNMPPAPSPTPERLREVEESYKRFVREVLMVQRPTRNQH